MQLHVFRFSEIDYILSVNKWDFLMIYGAGSLLSCGILYLAKEKK